MNAAQQTQMHFTWHEALAEDVKALGGRKKLAPRLWPSEDEETANDRLKAAMSPGHKQELKPMEVLRIKEWARAVGSDALVRFDAQYLGGHWEWLQPEDELTALVREIRESREADRHREDRMARLLERAEALAAARAVPK